MAAHLFLTNIKLTDNRLCIDAKQKLSNVWDKRPFAYKEIDVMAPEGKVWRDFYEFDTPVVRLLMI